MTPMTSSRASTRPHPSRIVALVSLCVLLCAACGGGVGTPASAPHQLTLIAPSSLATGRAAQLSAFVLDPDGQKRDVTTAATWIAEQPAILQVTDEQESKGTLMAIGMGQSYVRAYYGGQVAEAAVTVTAAEVDALAVSPIESELVKGATLQLSAMAHFSDGSRQDLSAAVLWASDTPDVIRISNEAGTAGLASALSEGTARITAVLGNLHDGARITVRPPTLR